MAGLSSTFQPDPSVPFTASDLPKINIKIPFKKPFKINQPGLYKEKVKRGLIKPQKPYNQDEDTILKFVRDYSIVPFGFRPRNKRLPDETLTPKGTTTKKDLYLLYNHLSSSYSNQRVELPTLSLPTSKCTVYSQGKPGVSNANIPTKLPPGIATTSRETRAFSSSTTKLRCDRGSDNLSYAHLKPFNRSKYLAYLQFKNNLEKKQWIEGHIKGREVLTEACLTEEYARSSLFERFGPMREDSKAFKRLCKTFLAGKREQLLEWRKIAEQELEIIQDACQIVENYEYTTDYTETTEPFTRAEIESFNLNPLTNTDQRDYYILPRQKQIDAENNPISQKRHKKEKSQYDYSQDSKAEHSNKNYLLIKSADGQMNNRKKHSAISLQVRENQFATFSERNTIISDVEEISIQLKYTLRTHINSAFCGVSEDLYFQQFKMMEGYIPRLFASTEHGERLTNVILLKDVFSVWPNCTNSLPKRFNPGTFDSDSILLPAYLRHNVCDLNIFLWRIWHLCLVYVSVFPEGISLKMLGRRLREVFGVSFNSKMWGFTTAKQFVEYLQFRWPRPGIFILEKTCGEFWLTEKARDAKAIPEIPLKVERIVKSIPQPQIPTGYARKDDTINHMQYQVFAGTTYRCFIPSDYSSSYFCVQIYSCWDSLKTMQFKLSTVMGSKEIIDKKIPHPANIHHPNLIKPFGHLVVVYHEKEWKRAMTLARGKYECNTFKVLLVDFGNFCNVDVSRMRYLPLDLTKFAAQAIPCLLSIPDAYKTRYNYKSHRWDTFMLRNFNRFHIRSDVSITFIKWHTQDFPRWEVELIPILQAHSDLKISRDFDMANRYCCSFPTIDYENETVTEMEDREIEDIPKSDGGKRVVNYLSILPRFNDDYDICLKLTE